jgi:hypothetical protein
MSTSLISIASQYLTPELLSKVSSTMGLDRSVIGKACSAAIPALFGRFANLASTPDGARTLFSAVSRQNINILDDLPNAVGRVAQQGLGDSGSLGSLLGGSSISSLSGAIGRFAGLSQSSASSLLGMVAPVLMAILGKQSAEQGLDSSSLARLLASQKDSISAAMPSGFRESSASERAAPQSRFSARNIQQASRGNTLAWVLPLIAVGLLAWWFLGNRGTTNVVEQTKPVSPQAQTNVTVAGGVDLKASAQKAIENVNTTLEGIKDESSAQAALSKLQSAGTELDNVIKLSTQLPEAGKKALGGVIAAAQPATTQLFDKVLEIPGVKEVAKPQIDSLKAKIDTLSKDQVRL